MASSINTGIKKAKAAVSANSPSPGINFFTSRK